MLVIDVDFNTLRSMGVSKEGLSFFYQENETQLTIYREFNGFLFRHIHNKDRDPNQNNLWQQQNLPNSVKIEKIEPFGDSDWKSAFSKLYRMIEEINRTTRKLK
jgi:hypothetical protein